ncbi:uncharacterized protein KY384_000250 [Bacidia gigantensis]|uniref:uncharacterized protein n=1 Tax=Bacidia gigantensis TaxID=2732470 RepID=UPI001D05B4AC|nr:uncharacterized protein KY384_000250 [Bacidia gigantensis]KAG8526257.1 hypothetical protein KY384_000250 [Bacidia gigantensis]
MRILESGSSVMETSKVQVEFSDPAGLFTLIQPVLQSISSLHIELVPDTKNAIGDVDATVQESSQDETGPRHRTLSSSGVPSKKERRHQFPGLRQTPYLKIYLLSGTDLEAYKSQTRPDLQEWVNRQTSARQSNASINKQEKHDAFEWLIVHILVDTTELSEVYASGKADSESIRKTSSSRWKARSSKTVIEKVRSDFNSPSKHAADRVTQIQLPSSQEIGINTKRDSQEDQTLLEDVVKKMKALILASFDRRVQQYEEDIREKELQRNLPGWNFNTYFVLKEGLAIGFESVGLIEDALTGYQELAAGLGAVVDEQLTANSESDASHFQDRTVEFQHLLEKCLAISEDNSTSLEVPQVELASLGSLVLNTDRKAFRKLILENNISIFDFQCYVFARQVSLQLRLANVPFLVTATLANPAQATPSTNGSNTKTTLNDAGQVNHQKLAHICELALTFIASSTWVIRQDVEACLDYATEQCIRDGRTPCPAMNHIIVENIVASWTFSACQSILDSTSTRVLSPHLEKALRQLRRSSRVHPELVNRGEERCDDDTRRKSFPMRASSLSFRSPSTASTQLFPLSESSHAGQQLVSLSLSHGAGELASSRGELLTLAKRTLATLGMFLKTWKIGSSFTTEHSETESSLEDVDLNDQADVDERSQSPFPSPKTTTQGIENAFLLRALSSKDNFYALYEDLTASTLAHYVISDQAKKIEATTADLAILYFHLEDFTTAVTYFRQLAPSYDDKEWSNLGTLILEMLAHCLRHLGYDNEYIAVALRALRRLKPDVEPRLTSSLSLGEVFKASASLKEQVTLPFDAFFYQGTLEPYIQHVFGQDTFEMHFDFQCGLAEIFEAHSLCVQAIGVGEEDFKKFSMCSGEGIATIKPGWYVVDKIRLLAGNIVFEQHNSQPSDALVLPGNKPAVIESNPRAQDSRQFMVWETSESLAVKVSPSRYIKLSQPRSIDVEIFSGWNDIIDATILVRAGSAGLRIHTAEAQTADRAKLGSDTSQSGSIRFDDLARDKKIVISIPYELEADSDEIQLRVEISYRTKDGTFTYASRIKVPLKLAITVNVQENFKKNFLFSRFSIGPATLSPIRLISTEITSNVDYDAQLFSTNADHLRIFDRQPYSAIGKIQRRRKDVRIDAANRIEPRIYMKIKYLLEDAMITKTVDVHLSEALAAAQIQTYSRLLSQHLITRLRSRMSAADLEIFALTQTVPLGSFADCGWDDVLQVLIPSQVVRLKQVLEGWHQKCACLPFDPKEREPLQRQLDVPVDIPDMMVVHTVQLRLDESIAHASKFGTCLTQGQTIPAELDIEHTRQWSRTSADGGPLDFCYKIIGSADDWLVGGHRSATFSAKPSDRHSFSVFLVPQKTGHLLLPNVQVHQITQSYPNGDEDGESCVSTSSVTCTTDYVNQGETVHVIPNVSSTTVSLAPDNVADGVWLLESQQRVESKAV